MRIIGKIQSLFGKNLPASIEMVERPRHRNASPLAETPRQAIPSGTLPRPRTPTAADSVQKRTPAPRGRSPSVGSSDSPHQGTSATTRHDSTVVPGSPDSSLRRHRTDVQASSRTFAASLHEDPPRPRIDIISTDVDASESNKSLELATMIAGGFMSTALPQVYYLGQLDPATATLTEKQAFQVNLAAHFQACNDFTIQQGGQCKEFRDAHGTVLGTCLFTPPSRQHGADQSPVDLQEGEEYIGDEYAEEAQQEFCDTLEAIWGTETAERFLEIGADSAEAVSEAFDDNKTLSIDMFCAAPERIGSGIGKAMLRQILSDPDVTQGAEHVMAVTYMNPDFWTRNGLIQQGEPAVAPDITRSDGVVLHGFNTTVHKGSIADVLSKLGAD